MAQTSNRPEAPGKFALHRVVASADTDPPTVDESRGLQCIGLEKVHIQVKVPGTKPVIKIWSWSPGAEKFVPLVPAVSFTGPADTTSFEFTYDCLGRTLYFTCSQACELWASGVRERAT